MPHSAESAQESPEVKINLSRMGVVLGVVAALFALAGAWVVLPYRMDQVEQKVRVHDTDLSTMKEVLIRIDENVKELKRLDRDDRRRDTRTTRTDP